MATYSECFVCKSKYKLQDLNLSLNPLDTSEIVTLCEGHYAKLTNKRRTSAQVWQVVRNEINKQPNSSRKTDKAIKSKNNAVKYSHVKKPNKSQITINSSKSSSLFNQAYSLRSEARAAKNALNNRNNRTLFTHPQESHLAKTKIPDTRQEPVRTINWTIYQDFLNSPQWKAFKKQYKSDKCYVCGKRTQLHLHHINYDNWLNPTNVVTLCHTHHHSAHSRRKKDMRAIVEDLRAEYLAKSVNRERGK